jgi:hypothetical protein
MASRRVAQGTKAVKSTAKVARQIEGLEKGVKTAKAVESIEKGAARATKVEQVAQQTERVEYTTKVANAEEVAPQGAEVRKGSQLKTKQGRIGKKSEGKGVNTTKLLQSKFPNSAKKYAKHSKEWSKWGPISEKAFCKRAIDLASSPVNNHFKGFISKKWLFVQI